MEIIQFLLIMISFNIVRSFFLTKYDLAQLNCGIIGFSGKRKSNPEKLTLIMLHNSLKRGEHNTGIYSLATGLVKTAEKAEDFLSKNILPRTNLFIGHVRKASVGSTIAENAHPFEFDNLVLAHNGTLMNHNIMCIDAGYKTTDFKTDTEILTKLLDDDSKKEDQSYTTLSEYRGAAALLFTDKRDPEVLYAYRNSERPLFYGFYSGGMYISSLKESLVIVGCSKIEEFPALFVHKIKNGVLLNSTYYKEKEAYNYQQSNNFHNVSKVHWKNPTTGPLVEAFVKIDKIRVGLLVDRWLVATTSKNDSYSGNTVNITKDKSYFVIDSAASNDYDLVIRDNDGQEVWVNKFLFNADNISYPQGYAYATTNIILAGSKNQVIFKKGDLVELVKNFRINLENCIDCVNGTGTISVPTFMLLPATKKEIDAVKAKNAEELNELLRLKSQGEFPFKDDKVTDATIIDELPIVQDTEEIIKERVSHMDETEAIITVILDKIDDQVDDLIDMARQTNWDELIKITQDLKEQINESYNIDAVKEYLESMEIKNT